MIYKIEMYGAICDNCKKTFGGYDHDNLVMPDELSMEGEISDSDWCKVFGKHYCDECYSYDDNDDLQIKTERFNP